MSRSIFNLSCCNSNAATIGVQNDPCFLTPQWHSRKGNMQEIKDKEDEGTHDKSLRRSRQLSYVRERGANPALHPNFDGPSAGNCRRTLLRKININCRLQGRIKTCSRLNRVPCNCSTGLENVGLHEPTCTSTTPTYQAPGQNKKNLVRGIERRITRH